MEIWNICNYIIFVSMIFLADMPFSMSDFYSACLEIVLCLCFPALKLFLIVGTRQAQKFWKYHSRPFSWAPPSKSTGEIRTSWRKCTICHFSFHIIQFKHSKRTNAYGSYLVRADLGMTSFDRLTDVKILVSIAILRLTTYGQTSFVRIIFCFAIIFMPAMASIIPIYMNLSTRENGMTTSSCLPPWWTSLAVIVLSIMVTICLTTCRL